MPFDIFCVQCKHFQKNLERFQNTMTFLGCWQCLDTVQRCNYHCAAWKFWFLREQQMLTVRCLTLIFRQNLWGYTVMRFFVTKKTTLYYGKYCKAIKCYMACILGAKIDFAIFEKSLKIHGNFQKCSSSGIVLSFFEAVVLKRMLCTSDNIFCFLYSSTSGRSI